MLKQILTFIKKRKYLVAGITVVVIVGLFITNKNSQPIEVRIYQVSKQAIIKNINASGEVRTNSSYIVKSPVTARIKVLTKKSGEFVNKDDVVLSFDEVSLVATLNSSWQSYLVAKAAADSIDDQIRSAEAASSGAKYERDNAERSYREDSSFDNKETYKSAEASYQSALSTLTVLKDKKTSIEQNVYSTYSSYAVSKQNFDSGKVKAPASGYLALSNIVIGDSITAGEELFSVVADDTAEFVAEIDEADVQSIKVGQKSVVSLEGFNDKDFQGEVSLIDAQTKLTSSGSNVVETSISVKFEDIKPIIGLTGNAEIEIGREDEKLAVPFDAILFEGEDLNYVFVMKDNRVEKRKISVGFEGDDYYSVKDGLSEGEKIVYGTDLSVLKDGSKVSANQN